MSTNDLVSLATAIVAIAAFLLSLYNFYVDRRDKTARLVVWLSQGKHTEQGKSPASAIFIEAANPSQANIVITDAYGLFGKQGIRISARNIEDGKQGAKLSPGENAMFSLPLTSVVASLREQGVSGRVNVRASVRDALGNLYSSKTTLQMSTTDLTE